MGDGRLGSCKMCKIAYQRSRVGEATRAIDLKRYRENPERVRQIRRQAIAYKEKYPTKTKARYLLNNAVRDGRLVRLPCQECGKKRSYGHHPDYSKPLEVVWLCAVHHSAEHRKMAVAS